MKTVRIRTIIASIIIVLLIPVLVFIASNWKMMVYYNDGNELYRQNEFEKAVVAYENALKWFPWEKQECDIRINLALSKIGEIDFDKLETNQDINDAIATLNEAKEVLLKDGCASDKTDEEGHNETAQQLKEDINRMIEDLENQLEEKEEETEDSKETEESKESESSVDEEQREIEEQLEAIEKEANDERYNESIWNEYYTSDYWLYNGVTW